MRRKGMKLEGAEDGVLNDAAQESEVLIVVFVHDITPPSEPSAVEPKHGSAPAAK
jgi:hypothetical protein